MAFKPIQPAATFAGIPDVVGRTDGVSFGRSIDVQEGIPLDGSNSMGRTYSPFLIRVVLPNIIGGDSNNQLNTSVNPQRSPSLGPVRQDNRDGVAYAKGQLESRVNPSGRTAYDRMVDRGNAVPGLTKATEQSLEDAYNQAVFQQQFGPTVRNSTQTPSSARTNNVTPALTNDTSALSLALQLKRLGSITGNYENAIHELMVIDD